MAIKKALAKATPSKGMVSWEEELAADAIAVAATEKDNLGGSFISHRGGVFSINGNIVNGPLRMIVLDHVAENAYYEGDFDPDSPQPPVCYAFHRPVLKDGEWTMEGMAPHPQAPDKQKQECKGCPQNEFGSAERGAGKACKNIRRLALMMPEQLDDIVNAEVMYMKLPVTSVKSWSGYVAGLAAMHKRPPYAMVTQFDIVKDLKTQYKITYSLLAPVDMEKYHAALKAKVEEQKTKTMFPYQAREAEEKPKAPARKRKY